MISFREYLGLYTQERPLFISLIRSKEAWIWQRYQPLKTPVLDLGCGDGFFAKIAFGKIDTGVDLADSRIDEAKQLKVYKRLIVYNGTRLPFRAKAFPTVVSNCVLEHVESLTDLLSEINRVLIPGGLFITTVATNAWENNLWGKKVFGKYYALWMRKKQKHVNLFTLNQWKRVFSRSGFEIQQIIGYLSPTACRLIELCHYVGIPNLVAYKLSGKWVPFKFMRALFPGEYLERLMMSKVNLGKSGALFLVLRKSS
jgi:SAM-dependent methyltransferase